MDLHSLGWNDFFQKSFNSVAAHDDILKPARIVCGYKNQYRINFGTTECLAVVSGKYDYLAVAASDYPVIGDWVAASYDNNDTQGIIHHLLPRKTYFSRKAAGPVTEEQVISANIDTGFIVTDFGYDFNIRRLERYLTLVYESGVNPVIILNKADLCDNTTPFLKQVETVAFGIPILIVSTKTRTGIEELINYLEQGKTASFIGSSGVGKSSIINILTGEDYMVIRETRAGGKGKHTTSHRELIILDNKGIVIDNPGMRELQLWATEDAAEETFSDIEDLTGECRFADCTHSHEPGCAVLKAVHEGIVDEKRFNSYLKQKREIARLIKKDAQRKRRNESRKPAKYIKMKNRADR